MHVSNLMNIHNIYDYATGDVNIYYTACLNIHEYVTETEFSWAHVTDDNMITPHGWHEYSWVQITGLVIFMSTRNRWHEYSWVGLRVTDNMNIHE